MNCVKIRRKMKLQWLNWECRIIAIWRFLKTHIRMQTEDISTWKPRKFYRLPKIKWDARLIFDSLIIIPDWRIHESGYRIIRYVPCIESVPLGIWICGSDVLHFDGIGGYGWIDIEKDSEIPDCIPPRAWSFDILARSGFVQLFCHKEAQHLRMGISPTNQLIMGYPVSSAEIYAIID